MTQATVKTRTEEQTNTTYTKFKLRLNKPEKNLNHEQYRTNTSLSSYLWDLKNDGKQYDIEWDLIGRAKPFSPISNTCNLCTLEKHHILFTPELATIDKQQVNSLCLHKAPVLLDKTRIPGDRIII